MPDLNFIRAEFERMRLQVGPAERDFPAAEGGDTDGFG
jgi:hypothetical protein